MSWYTISTDEDRSPAAVVFDTARDFQKVRPVNSIVRQTYVRTTLGRP